MSRVWWRMPGTSEARKNSPSPRPRTMGGPKRAATSLSGSAAESTPMAKAPVRRRTARRTASSSGMEEAEAEMVDSAESKSAVVWEEDKCGDLSTASSLRDDFGRDDDC